MSQIAELLKAALVKAGRKVTRVWWVPLSRGCEMQGPAGGWMYEDEHGEDCLGCDAVMAIEHIVTDIQIAAFGRGLEKGERDAKGKA